MIQVVRRGPGSLSLDHQRHPPWDDDHSCTKLHFSVQTLHSFQYTPSTTIRWVLMYCVWSCSICQPGSQRWIPSNPNRNPSHWWVAVDRSRLAEMCFFAPTCCNPGCQIAQIERCLCHTARVRCCLFTQSFDRFRWEPRFGRNSDYATGSSQSH